MRVKRSGAASRAMVVAFVRRAAAAAAAAVVVVVAVAADGAADGGASPCALHALAPAALGALRVDWSGECSGAGVCNASNVPRVCVCEPGWNG